MVQKLKRIKLFQLSNLKVKMAPDVKSKMQVDSLKRILNAESKQLMMS